MARQLDPEEVALWRRVAASVRPLNRRTAMSVLATTDDCPRPRPRPRAVAHYPSAPPPPSPARATRPPPIDRATLDGGWDRRLAGGRVAPDRIVDLHGMTLATAHDRIEQVLAEARRDGDRLLLLVTGRPPRPGPNGEVRRGLIRSQILDWLAGSAHAGTIAAVRGAHPRHGGAGALYLVLRRDRTATLP